MRKMSRFEKKAEERWRKNQPAPLPVRSFKLFDGDTTFISRRTYKRKRRKR